MDAAGLQAGPGWRAYLLLALFALVLFLPGRARLPPVDRDEARYAQSTREMLESGDFIDIRFNGQPRNLQPAGVYWLEAASASVFGGPDARAIWAYRIPSLLAAIAAVLLTCRIGAMLFGSRAGVGAAVLLALCALLSFESRIAKIDACLLATVLVAQGALLRAYLDVGVRTRLNALAFWTALGVGLMLKGPIVLIVSGGTVAVLVASERRGAWLKRLHAGWGAAVMLAIAAPWFVAIGLRTHGAFFHKAVAQNLLGKIGRGEQHHGQPPGYYALLTSLTFWPGSLALALALPWTWRNRTTPQVRFLLAWIAPTWLMYEAIGTKLPHYVLPLYPALACLAAGAAVAVDGWRPRGWGWRAAAWAYAAVWLLVCALLAAAGAWLVWRYEQRLDLWAVGVGGVVFALGLATLALVRAGARGAALATAAASALVLYADLYAHALPALHSLWLAPRMAVMTAAQRPCPDSLLISTRFAEPSLIFLEAGPTRVLDPVAAADVMAHDACAMTMVSARQSAAFTARAAADGLKLQPRGEVDGVNYSTGERLRLTLFTSARPPSAPPPAAPLPV